MHNLKDQLSSLSDLLGRHQKLTHFSGVACLITGILWLTNFSLDQYFHYTENQQIISMFTVSILSIIFATFLTLYETHKHGKKLVNLSLLSIIDRLIIISFSTSAIAWFLYDNDLVLAIPALLMLMYGILILMSKDNLITSLKYFGYTNLILGLTAFILPTYSIYLAAAALGLGHIIIGFFLISHDKKNS